eukprot:8245078-Pyramimonas_sp.AAC.1
MAATYSSAARPPTACDDHQVSTSLALTTKRGPHGGRHVSVSTFATSYAHHSVEDSQAPTARTSHTLRY